MDKKQIIAQRKKQIAQEKRNVTITTKKFNELIKQSREKK